MAILLRKMGMTSIDASDLTPAFDRFSLFYCGLFLCVAVFPLLIMKQITFLIKINSKGIYFVSILILYVFYTGIHSLTNTTFDFEYKQNMDAPNNEIRHLYLFGENPALLAGSLSLGYFSHSFVLPMMKNNENQENNKRDLLIGYILVAITYISIGIFGYIGFSGSNYEALFKDVKK